MEMLEKSRRLTTKSWSMSSPTNVSLIAKSFHVYNPTVCGAWNCSLYARKSRSFDGSEKGTSVIFMGGTTTRLDLPSARRIHQPGLRACEDC